MVIQNRKESQLTGDENKQHENKERQKYTLC